MDKFDSKLVKHTPIAHKAFFGKKYIVPHYRQADYANLDNANSLDYYRVLKMAMMELDDKDDVMRGVVSNTFAALHYNRPTLYLERELAEALLRTDILDNIVSGDIHWPWPAFRVVLPSYLLSIDRKQKLYLTHFDVCRIGSVKDPLYCPPTIAEEFDKFAAFLHKVPNLHVVTKTQIAYSEAGICISTYLNAPETSTVSQTMYGITKPWGDINLGEYRAIMDSLSTEYEQDDADKQLLQRLEHLAINVLLFLSATPIEYNATPKICRPSRKEGQRIIPALVEARFVGATQIRALPSHPYPKHAHELTGRTVAPHWVKGYWKRQPHGKGRLLRKLIWIEPYQTGREFDTLSKPNL
jgi:hypothetical protein